MTAEEALDLVNDAQAGVNLASGDLERAVETRRWAIDRALDAGASQADIARATGLTRARIAQILSRGC